MTLSKNRSLGFWVCCVVINALGLFVSIASPISSSIAVLLGILFTAGTSLGFVGIHGFFIPDSVVNNETAQQDQTLSIDAAHFIRPAVALFGSILLLIVMVRLSVAGRLGPILGGLGITLTFLTTGLCGHWLARTFASTTHKPIHHHYGFWLFTISTFLYIPFLGSHSLIDPWETHYGEVSREILARQDWISLWWAQDGWFFSKPVLLFWMDAISMAVFGVHYQSGQLFSEVTQGYIPWPEWALRIPIAACSIGAIYGLYKIISKLTHPRAGFIAAIALLTMPQWAMMSGQNTPDLPFAAMMAIAMFFFLRAIHTDSDETVSSVQFRIFNRSIVFSKISIIFFSILIITIPQINYLTTRNISIRIHPFSFALHPDFFDSGSPLPNCTLPGNDACRTFSAVFPALSPALQAILWIQVLAAFFYINWSERRSQRIYAMTAWYFAALSTMAKGPAGFAIPVVCALAYLFFSGQLQKLLHLEIASGLLILAAIVGPWLLAMYARHGDPFVDRLFFHDMYARAFVHVHDTNEGEDVGFRYYLWQLGYGIFPWSGFAPFAFTSWMRLKQSTHRFSCNVLFSTWFLIVFSLFSLMLTKFHHYILPALPAIAGLIGIYLHESENNDLHPSPNSSNLMFNTLTVAGCILVFLTGLDFVISSNGSPTQARLLHLFSYNYKRLWPPLIDFSIEFWIAIFSFCLLMLLLAFFRIKHILLSLWIASSVLFSAWVVNRYIPLLAPHWGQRETVLAYYEAAKTIPGPIVAYQMNWKGENFYTGNSIAAFVSSGRKFQDYITQQKEKGVTQMYFMTEHSRVASLTRELGVKKIEKLTNDTLNNKFVLVRATLD